MDPATPPFTQDQLEEAGLLRDGVTSSVTQALETMRDHPELLQLSLHTLQCMDRAGRQSSVSTSGPLAISDSSTASPTPSNAPGITLVSQYNVPEFEKVAYYHGLSANPPELLYRSNYRDEPFRKSTGQIQHISTKTAHGVFNTPLNPVWPTLAPKIRNILKDHNIRYSAFHAARFVTRGEDGQKDSLGPPVIWISTHPSSTTPEAAHFASLDISALLEANEVHGVAVEWFEGAIEKMSGPSLLRVTENINPTYHLRRFLTAGLGMPIASAEREDDDAQGSVAFFFHENKDRRGNASSKVLAVSNCHVLRRDTTIPYQFEGAGAPPQHVRVAGCRRFQRASDEIRGAIAGYGNNANTLAQEIEALRPKLKSEDKEEAAEAAESMEDKRTQLAKLQKDLAVLEAFEHDVHHQWGNIACRNIGHVEWAPAISVDTEGYGYTKDFGTFEVDADRFRAQFKGNVVDLGAKYTSWELTQKFYPQSNGKTTFNFPTNRQLRINGCLTREQLAHPDSLDSNGEACIIVMKDGNTTDLTVGRFAGLEAYTCDELGVESIELAIYNENKESGPFSAKGDSGSLIFDGKGRMVGVLHSGIVKGGINLVTYVTPAWWVIEQLKLQYPHADFNRDEF